MLETNLLNLGILDTVKEGFADLGVDFEDVKNAEYDMALGNGGLGRLAAAFMDSLATTGYPGFGNGIRYRYGLFKQRIVDGYQVEIPDAWFGSLGNVWIENSSDVLHPATSFNGRIIQFMLFWDFNIPKPEIVDSVIAKANLRHIVRNRPQDLEFS